jgi:ribosomal protein S20
LKVYDEMTRRLMATVMCAGLTCALSGCLHRRAQVPVLPAVLEPVALVTVPPPEDEPMLTPPEITLPPTPVAAAAASPRRERRHIVPKTTAAVPDETAPAPMTDTVAIGELTAGGAANPQAQQGAADLIASIEKRLNTLSAQTIRRQRTQINKVRNFQRQAQEALNSGDIEGANTLATKAKLLLDDLEKQGNGDE